MNRLLHKDGFTLLELVITTGLFAIGLLGLTLLTSGLMAHNTTARQRSTALLLAQNKLEMLRQGDYSKASDTVENGIDANGISGKGIFYREVAVVESHDPDFKTISVTVTWHSKGMHQVTLQSILAAP